MQKKNMRVFKNILFCLAVMVTCSIILSTAGCRVLRPANERIVHDTVQVEKVIVKRDTVLKAGPASVSVAVHVPCPDQDFKPVERLFKHAKLTLRKEGDSLKADCFCDTNAIKAQLVNTYEKKNQSRTETSTRTVRERYVPGPIIFLAWSGALFWGIVIVAVTYIITKKLRQ